jgi:hypothetical protein
MDWLALLVVPAIWALAVFASPFVRVRRHSVSLPLSIIAGLLGFASLRVASEQIFAALFVSAGLVTAAMFVVMFWPERRTS